MGGGAEAAETRVAAANLIHRGIGRVEFFDLPEDQVADLAPLIDAIAAEGRPRFSFHSPVTRPADFPYSGVTCFYLSEDEGLRERSFALLEATMAAARRWGAAYVVSHLTYGPTDSKDPATAARLAAVACRRMAEMSRRHGVPLDVEFAAYTDAFHRAEDFVAAVAAHPELGLCIDAGHAYLGGLIRERDHLADIARMAPVARSLHLWNSKGLDYTARHHHAPLHPTQSSAEGWIDIEPIVEIAASARAEINVVFEYPVDDVTPEIQAGYDWVAGMLARYRTPER